MTPISNHLTTSRQKRAQRRFTKEADELSLENEQSRGCPECGHCYFEYEDGDRFCEDCGFMPPKDESVSAADTPSAAPTQTTVEATDALENHAGTSIGTAFTAQPRPDTETALSRPKLLVVTSIGHSVDRYQVTEEIWERPVEVDEQTFFDGIEITADIYEYKLEAGGYVANGEPEQQLTLTRDALANYKRYPVVETDRDGIYLDPSQTDTIIEGGR